MTDAELDALVDDLLGPGRTIPQSVRCRLLVRAGMGAAAKVCDSLADVERDCGEHVAARAMRQAANHIRDVAAGAPRPEAVRP